MINFLRSAPCKTISLLPTIKDKCICATRVKAKAVFLHVQYVCVHYWCHTEPYNNWPVVIFPWTHPTTSVLDPLNFRSCAAGQEEQVLKLLIFGVIYCSLLHCWTWTTFSWYWLNSSKTSSFHPQLTVKAKPFLPTIWKLSWTQRPKKTRHKQTSLLAGRNTLVFDMLAAMVIAQTSVQQQHINPSWPSILTCDKRGGREEGGAPLSTAPHFRVPGHQQALESPRSLGALYSCGCRKNERRGKRRGGRGALSLKDNVWSRLETCGHWMKRGSREKQCFHTEAPS